MPLAPGEPDRPGVVAPPPLVALGPTLAALLLEFVLPTTLLPVPARWAVGGALLGLGLALPVWGFVEQRRAGTDPLPDHPSTAIVATGPYAYSRNPMYVGFLLVAAAVSVLADSAWGLAGIPVGLGLLVWGVVLREERYLERKFGDDYLAYKRRVRRWL